MVELEKDDGGPAFPTGDDPNSKLYANYGMSLRDYFAAKAMPGVCERVQEGGFDRVAQLSYEIADAMLAERAK